jgi:hypothetical protein
VFAAPFLKILLDARLKLKAAGLFGDPDAVAAGAGAPGTGPPGPDEDGAAAEDDPLPAQT